MPGSVQQVRRGVYVPRHRGEKEADVDDLAGFQALPRAERELVRAATKVVSLAKGQLAFLEGEPAEHVWAVQDGLVHIVKSGPAGREIVLEVIAPGELFGAVVALEDRPYPASAIAAQPSVVRQLPARVARELCARHPTLRGAILAQVTARLRAAHARLQSVALEPVEQRLARVLLGLAGKLGEERDGVVVLAVTRQELADMVGTTVETAIRVTSKWQRAGVVGSARNALSILDPTALRAIAEALA